MQQLQADIYRSPIDDILMLADGAKLCYLGFVGNDKVCKKMLARGCGEAKLEQAGHFLDMPKLLDEYFAGNMLAFAGLEMDICGSDFQLQVWRELLLVPSGITISYQQLAQRIAKPNAYRAVATAVACNPIAIASPCHRIIGTDGSLRGYAYGVWRKKWLLAHEKNHTK